MPPALGGGSDRSSSSLAYGLLPNAQLDMQTPVRTLDPEDSDLPDRSSGISEPIPLLAMVNAVLRSRGRIIFIAALLGTVVGAYVLLSKRLYVSTASFSLQGSDTRQFSGIAAQIGLALPAAGGTQSPAYYVELLGSREILGRAADSPYFQIRDGKRTSVTLADIYGVKESDSALRQEETVRRLRTAITSEKSRETGIVGVSVSAPSPVLAQQLLGRLLDLLNEFNLKTRQSQAANERHFIEQRLAEVSVDLRTAENRLQDFLQRNRGGIGNTPELAFEHDRLSREVALRQQVYTSLAQSYEQARIDEVRDTPAMTIIEAPNLPVRPASRGFVRKVLLAIILGLVIGILPIVLQVLMSAHHRTVEEEAAEFQRLRSEIGRWRRMRVVDETRLPRKA